MLTKCFRAVGRMAACVAFLIGANVGVASAAERITVGVIPILDTAPIFLGKAKGIFARHDLDPDLQLAQGGAAFVPGVLNGQYQFAYSNMTTLVVARARGIDLVAVAMGVASTNSREGDSGGIVAAADSPLRTAKDLEGRTVAVNNLRNIGDTTTRQAVRVAGGDPDKVRFVELAFADMPAAFAAKRIEAAWMVEPFLTTMRGQGARVIAWNLIDTAPNLMLSAYFTSGQYIRDHGETVRRFVAAMSESLEYTQTHPDDVREIVTTYTRIPKDVVAKVTLPRWPVEMNRQSTSVMADLAVKDGIIGKKPDLDQLFYRP
ncbi:MAG: ABC transporter substrate-binding protein [Xanthobacteraceae bacterium]